LQVRIHASYSIRSQPTSYALKCTGRSAFGKHGSARPTRSTAALSRWAVLSHARILHTLAIGEVSSKRTAGEWALHALDPEWAPLIRWALEDRPDPWTKVREPADPALLRRTRQFIDYAAGWSAER